jgi:hypothetical protein
VLVVLLGSAFATSVVQPPATDATAAPAADDTPPHPLAFDLEVGLGFVDVPNLSPGPALTLGLDLGYHFDRTTTVGLHVSEGAFSGSIPTSPQSYSYIPISVEAFAAERFLDICWGGVLLGAHFERIAGGGMATTWNGDVLLGFMAGVDIWRWQDQSLGVFALAESGITESFMDATVGVTYRR